MNPSNIPEKFLKPYDPVETEPRIYKLWEESGFFNPDICIKKGITAPDAEPYTIILPPPNVTGILHMGHALMAAIEDIEIRFHRMRGYRTLWVPGTDHAAIATQSRVEKDIQKSEGKTRHDLGREEMLKRINTHAKQSQASINAQIKTLGASCDWSREAFTLDDARHHAVYTAFKRMYDAGLIYRGHRIVNWDPKGQTTISDDEIVYEERQATLYTFKYSADFPIAISTTRPETKVGDTAVAVHPDDPRYAEFVGKEYDVAFCGVPLHIKIIADKAVEKDFGTGALGVTPAHSMIDWEIADRHKLPRPQVINEYARMMVGDDRIKDKKTTEARIAVVEWLRAEKLLLKEEPTTQNISTAERTGGIVEPLPKLQWFMAVNKPFVLSHSQIDGIPSGGETTLKEIMRKAVEGGQISILPDYFSKTYFHWINNLNDWCISRQIWYGHRIPVWYKGESTERPDEIWCDLKAPEGSEWKQDEDTLDTWFSSGLWTFSTLGWPDNFDEKTGKIKAGFEKSDLAIYHPTDLLETGYEILFFWVARMILMSGFHLGTVPFKKIYLHGTVRDAQGRKMSKSLGNGIDPMDVAKKYGMDAGRMALVLGAAPGIDTKISEDKIKGQKHFANKLWNITRFVLQSTIRADETIVHYGAEFKNWSEADKALIAARDTEIQSATQEIEDLNIHIAAERLYHYAWHTFADTILEDSKKIIGDNFKGNTVKSGQEVDSRQQFLLQTLRTLLMALHPFMPFVTEEIWSSIPSERIGRKDTPLIVEQWPRYAGLK
ncbi:MAG: valine--tRNA ligase [Candidatus Pacebacteria bacterium]|nr:valine--tRNA ligase [Candidatus Paceibacterota bacterium]